MEVYELDLVAGAGGDCPPADDGGTISVGTGGVSVSSPTENLGDVIIQAYEGAIDAASHIGERSGAFGAISTIGGWIGSAHEAAVGATTDLMVTVGGFLNHRH